MVDNSTKKNWILFILGIVIFFQGCSPPTHYNSEIIDSIPESWSVKVDSVEKFTGNWWDTFEDSTFSQYYFDFQSNSPDLKSIIGSWSVSWLNNANVHHSFEFPYNSYANKSGRSLCFASSVIVFVLVFSISILSIDNTSKYLELTTSVFLYKLSVLYFVIK